MRHEVWPGYEKVFQWRVDLIKIDVGSKSTYARIDAVWPRPKQETAAGNEVRQDFWVRDTPGINCLGLVASDTLIAVTLEIALDAPNGTPWPGAFYAPFVIDRFTQDATPTGPGQPKRATIYWLLSTWNPYVVVVMQSTLELNCLAGAIATLRGTCPSRDRPANEHHEHDITNISISVRRDHEWRAGFSLVD